MAEAAAANTNAQVGVDTAAQRRMMVERQLRTFDVSDVPVLQRFVDVPREAFLPADLAPLAYSDMAIALKDAQGRKGRTLLPPLVLARLIQGAAIRPEHKVLDIGGGAGYSAALLSGLAAEVVALESDAQLAEQARANLQKLGVANVRVEQGALEKGVPATGLYDVILIHGRIEDGLEPLFAQLAPNGHLVAIVKNGVDGGQQVLRFERSEGRAAGERALFDAIAPVLPGFQKAAAFAF